MHVSRSSRLAAAAGVTASIILAGCTFSFQSGPLVVGEGPLETETRTVDGFDEIEADGGVKVQLTIGTPTSVQVEAQQNLLPITSTIVANGKLTVTTTQSHTSTPGITVIVSTPAITTIGANGGAAIRADGVSVADLDLDTNGGAAINIAGTASTLGITANGGSLVDGTNFVATNAELSLDGGSLVTVGVSASASGSADGGSLLTILGNPPSVTVTASGGASVNH